MEYHDDTPIHFDEPFLSEPTIETSTTPIDVQPSIIHLSHLVDSTPLGVDPSVSMEFVLDLFKKMGLRLIVIKKLGKLLGIITKKDLLRLLESPHPVSFTQTSLPNLFIPLEGNEDAEESPQSTTTHRYKTLTLDEEMELLR
jgi:hypothetical protein